jgi:hypothetical protein
MGTSRFDGVVLVAAAAMPVALGIAMHLEHESAAVPVVVSSTSAEVSSCEPAEPQPELDPGLDPEPPPKPDPLPTRPEAPARYGEEFLFVTQVGTPHVVLSLEPDDAWGTGPVRALEEEWGTVVRDVDTDAMPPGLQELEGRALDLYGEDGRPCTGVVGRPFVVSEYAGELDYLLPEGEGEAFWEESEGSTTLPDRAVDPVWKEGRRLLVAPVSNPQRCSNPIWARPREFAAPLVRGSDRRRGAAVFGPTKEALVAALGEVEVDGDDLQDELIELAMQEGSDPVTPRERMDAMAWFEPDGEASLISVRVDGPEFFPCGGLRPRWAIASVTDEGRIVDRLEHGMSDRIASILDLDRDGISEVLFTGAELGRAETRLSTWTADGLVVRYELPSVPYIGCPC